MKRSTLRANIVARRAADFAVWVEDELQGRASLENPDTSYLWVYARKNFGSPKRWKDFRLSYCRYGKRYKKNTRFRAWKLNLHRLQKMCTKKGGKNTCGRPEHEKLEGSAKTAAAAVYPEEVCTAYANCLLDLEKELQESSGESLPPFQPPRPRRRLHLLLST